MTQTLERLAETSIAARGGADLMRFAMSNPIPDLAFAKNSDGTMTVKGIDLLKVGLFNGVVQVLEEDLAALVVRFGQLRDSGVFVPPFRLDHSWSVLSVIGYFDTLEVYTRTDETDGIDRSFLRGDVVLTGSLDYTPEQIVAAIKRGALRDRSSELGYYVTNQGTELPLVFYGAAYVDIPAVEGLAPVALAKHRPEPRTITNLSATEGSTMPPETATDEAVTGNATNTDTDGASTTDVVAETDAAATAQTADVVVGSPDADLDAEGNPVEPVVEEGTPAGTTDEAPAGAPADELTELRAENTRLRTEAADRVVTGLRSGGVLTQENEGDARFLLTHDSAEVRRRSELLLGALPAAVKLGRKVGKVGLGSGVGSSSGSDAAGSVIRVGMSKDEVGALWVELGTEGRKTHQSDYDAWRLDREQNNVRD